jgi:hypothetical protein
VITGGAAKGAHCLYTAKYNGQRLANSRPSSRTLEKQDSARRTAYETMKSLFIFLTLVLIMNTVDASDQKISSLLPSDLAAMTKQRAVVEKFLSKDDLQGKYLTAVGKLGTLRALLGAKLFTSKQTYELQSMGIVLGDVFIQDMGFEWVIVQDALGRDRALQYRDSKILLFPITMISKRVERGEEVDIFDLYNGIAAEATKRMQSSANTGH